MNSFGDISVLIVCIILCVSGSDENLPVLKKVSHTVLFRVSDDPQPFSLVCRTTTEVRGVIYTWQKNGKLLITLRSDVVQRKGEGSLIFITPNNDDEGQYQCFANSVYGTASTGIINARRTYMDIPKKENIGHYLVEGKPYKLNCSIPDGYPEPEINWIIQSESNPKIWKRILDQRITKSPDGSLYFSNITKVDFSNNQKYICQAHSPAVDKPVVISEHYAENIRELMCPIKKELVEQYVSKNMTVEVGAVAFLYCIYGGTPLPSMKWFKEGKEITNEGLDRVSRYNWSHGKRLIIRDVFPDDGGVYTCTADNKVGVLRRNSIYVIVVSKPVFKKNLEPQLTVNRGADVNISCQIVGVPLPNITWTYNARPLKKPKKLTINERKSDNTTVSELLITNVQRSDEGYYGCRGVNKYGDLYGETLLHIPLSNASAIPLVL